jgi:hypothetical protein
MALETIHGGILEFLIASMSERSLNVLMADGTVLRKELFLSQGIVCLEFQPGHSKAAFLREESSRKCK